ncbi:MAG TPA: indole-3-glycerol phosphate synthase TrpC [Cytophagales bacterium]|nr:indole-3-glycerol phosphate synthase TrpC [Cytophagales bacterium]
MNILSQITLGKYKEVEERKEMVTLKSLENSEFFGRNTVSLKNALENSNGKHGIIAEFKRKSPSKGIFSEKFEPVAIAKSYVEAGATALSILTDGPYFGGSSEDLMAVRRTQNVPILRKDFMVDEYQMVEAKAWGADVVLLIAAAIDSALLNRLAKFAKSLGLETLLEIHEIQELEGNLSEYIDIVGVNNRNLKDFTVDIERSIRAVEHIPAHFTRISESGISRPETITHLKGFGYKGFLMGEAFMQTPSPEYAIRKFVEALQ